ncbi:MotE family protein [Sporosarcina sp. CAU 1771]
MAKKEKSSGKFLTIMLFVLIPVLAVSAVLLIIAKFTDVNVFDKVKEMTSELPFVDGQSKDDGTEGTDNLILEERVVDLQAEIKEKEAQLFKLEQELTLSAEEKQELMLKQEELLYEIELLSLEKDDTKRKFTEIVSTFEKMSAKSVAPVIVKMDDTEAVRILTSLKPDTLAAVLEKMTPDDAAKYTSIMSN